MRINLPTDLLRSFVTIVDTGSMVKASEHICLTQSAISLQMKRLADLIQQPIFRRLQGNLTLTAAGERLLEVARNMLELNDGVVGALGAQNMQPVRIGMVQDFAETILSDVLGRFHRSTPNIRLLIRVGYSVELLEMFASNLLDIVLYVGDPEDAASVAKTKLAWLGDPELLFQRVMPIAVMTKPCRFRDAAIASLEAAGREFSIVLETPSVSVLRAATESGLALTCRTPHFLGLDAQLHDLGDLPLPHVGYNMAVSETSKSTVTELLDLMKAAMVKL